MALMLNPSDTTHDMKINPSEQEPLSKTDRWYYKSNTGYKPLPDKYSIQLSQTPLNATIQFSINDNNIEYKYEIKRVSKNCAWQKNIITNGVRPVIFNYHNVNNEKQILKLLNQKQSRNPWAATKADQTNFMKQKYQRFGQILPGDAYTGGNYKWLHCSHMDRKKIEKILRETAKSIDNIDELLEQHWFNKLQNAIANIDPLSKEWFIKMIKLYSYEGGKFYKKLNWNLRSNEWYNVQQTLAPVIFALKCACEGYCYSKFKDSQFKPFGGIVHRVIDPDYSDETVKQILDHHEGDEIYWGGFSSCTKTAVETEEVSVVKYKYNITDLLKRHRQLRGGGNTVLMGIGDVYAVEQKEKEKKRKRTHGILAKIEISKEHKCALDISALSDMPQEEEVLISCFTRFRITKIISEPTSRYIEVHLTTLPPKYENWTQWKLERDVRENLAALCYQYAFQEAVDLIKQNKELFPDLVNSTRPDSSKFWTIGHQIANSKNQHANEWVEQLIKYGYWIKSRDNNGMTIFDLGIEIRDYAQSTAPRIDKSRASHKSHKSVEYNKQPQPHRKQVTSKSFGWRCPKCKQNNGTSYQFCPTCGQPKEWKCTKCNKKNAAAHRFCVNCGKDSDSGCIVM